MSFPLGFTIIPKDFLVEVSKGNVPGHSLILKFGHVHLNAPGTPEDVWSNGGNYGFYPGAAEAMEVVSSSVNDGAKAVAPTGAFTVRVYGLNNNFDMIQEDVALDGTTPVNLTNEYRRVYRMEITDGADRDNSNLGVITCRIQGSGTTAAIIDIGVGQTLMAIYTIPRNYIAFMIRLYVSCVKNDEVELAFRAAKYNPTLLTPFVEKEHLKLYQGIIESFRGYGSPITHKTDIKLRANSTVGGDVSGGFDLLLVHRSALTS